MLRSNMRPLVSFLLLLMTLGGTACKKDSNNDNTIELLVAAPWKFSRVTASGIDVSGLVDACFKDNLLTLVAPPASTGTLDEGPTKCNPSDPQTISFTWSYDASLRKLTFSSPVAVLPGASPEATLVRLSRSELVLSQTVTFSGAPQQVELTLVH